MWTKEQIDKHKRACEKLNQIKNESFDFIRKNKNNISEFRVQQFIIKRFKELGLKSDKDPPIVAFNENSTLPHYFPHKNCKNLTTNSLILIDIWAKLKEKDAPFSDITWMAYYGEVPDEISNTFSTIINARAACIEFIKSNLKKGKLPVGKDIDLTARKIIISKGYGQYLKHKTGHALGIISCHGRHKSLHHKTLQQLKKNLGYTIEPGIYLPNKFGIRSEINFLIDENLRLILTSTVQKEIIMI